MEEVDVESWEARQALNNLGYTVGDILANSSEHIPEIFSSYKKEFKQMYLAELEKSRKQRLRLYLQELEDLKEQSRKKMETKQNNPGLDTSLKFRITKPRPAPAPNRQNVLEIRDMNDEKELLKTQLEFQTKEEQLREKYRKFEMKKKQELIQKKHKNSENMQKHLIKADLLNERKVARALESVNRIKERMEQTEDKKRRQYQKQQQVREKKESERESKFEKICESGEYQKEQQRLIQERTLQEKINKSEKILQNLTQIQNRKKQEASLKREEKLRRVDEYNSFLEGQQEKQHESLTKKEELIEKIRTKVADKKEELVKLLKMKHQEKEKKNEQNFSLEKRRHEIRQEETLLRINQGKSTKKDRLDVMSVGKVERKIVEYARTLENQRRYEIAKRRDHNQKLKSIKGAEKQVGIRKGRVEYECERIEEQKEEERGTERHDQQQQQNEGQDQSEQKQKDVHAVFVEVQNLEPDDDHDHPGQAQPQQEPVEQAKLDCNHNCEANS